MGQSLFLIFFKFAFYLLIDIKGFYIHTFSESLDLCYMITLIHLPLACAFQAFSCTCLVMLFIHYSPIVFNNDAPLPKIFPSVTLNICLNIGSKANNNLL